MATESLLRDQPNASDGCGRRDMEAWLASGLIVIVMAIWFGTLGVRTLIPSDEGRYAEIAREMVATGDWVTIRYNGVKYFEKPPLHMWMGAAAFELFGVGEWQARLGGATVAALAMLALGWACYRWYGRQTAWLCAFTLVALPAWNFGAHFNSTDVTVAGLLTCALAAFLLARLPGQAAPGERRWMIACWAAMGLATLAKGLIGLVLPGLALLTYLVITRQTGVLRRLYLLPGLAVYLAVVLPWFGLVTYRNPEFLSFFFVHEHWQRFSSTIHQRQGSPWYFLVATAVGLLPWTLLVRQMVAQALPVRSSAGEFHPPVLAGAWIASILLFFSASSSKLPGYILPVFPTLAMLLALALVNIPVRVWQRQLIAMAIACLLISLTASPLASRVLRPQYLDLYPLMHHWVRWATSICVAGIGLAWLLSCRGRRFESILTVAVSIYLATTLMTAAFEPLGRARAGIALVVPIAAELEATTGFYSVRRLDHTLPFYLQRTMTMVEYPDELAFGTRQEPDKWIPTLERFIEIWTHGPRALAVMAPGTFSELEQRRVPMVEVTRDPSRVVVVNRRGATP